MLEKITKHYVCEDSTYSRGPTEISRFQCPSLEDLTLQTDKHAMQADQKTGEDHRGAYRGSG